MVPRQKVGSPRVSIGLPVFNGEAFISNAIEAVRNQTFRDFELVICDNASTDDTERICRAAAAEDGRIHYHRNPQNIGAAANFNAAFLRSSPGEYFKWLAYDDSIEPTYLERCVSALDADPDAVLCQTLTRRVDVEGRELEVYDSSLVLTRTSSLPSERFGACILQPHQVVEFFGLIRRSALEGSIMHRSYFLADKVLEAELSLRGRFLQIPEPLFNSREHGSRATRSVNRVTWGNRLNLSDSSWNRFSHLMVYVDYIRMVHRIIKSTGERLRCYRKLAAWWGVKGNFKQFVSDGIGFVNPRVYNYLRDAKQRRLESRIMRNT